MKCPRCHKNAALYRWTPQEEKFWPWTTRVLSIAGKQVCFSIMYPRFIQRDWTPKEQDKAEKDAERYSERPRSEFKCYECFFEWDEYPAAPWEDEQK